MHAIDTNILVRLLVRDDAAQVIAAEAFVENGAWVSHLVLVETIWVLEAIYARTPRQLANAIALLLNHTSITLQDVDVVALALANFQAKPALGFSDCMVLEIARKSGHVPLGTFDKGLAKLADVTRVQ